MNPFENLISTGNLKKEANTSGGEYHGPCPLCGAGGANQFVCWPWHPDVKNGTGRWFCRSCHEKTDDGISFLMLKDGISFPEAKERLGASIPAKRFNNGAMEWAFRKTPEPRRKEARPIPKTWAESAASFVAEAETALKEGTRGWAYLTRRRFLKPETIRKYRLGWNPVDRYPYRREWGLEPETDANGKLHEKICLWAGIVIPVFGSDGGIRRIKIKRLDIAEGPSHPVVKGGDNAATFLPAWTDGLPAAVVESDLDAIFLAQEAGDFINAVSTGSANIFPDAEAEPLLEEAHTNSVLLIATDFDEGGETAAKEYAERYRWSIRPNPPALPIESAKGKKPPKDPTDFAECGADVREWILSELPAHIRGKIEKAKAAKMKAEQREAPLNVPPAPELLPFVATDGMKSPFNVPTPSLDAPHPPMPSAVVPSKGGPIDCNVPASVDVKLAPSCQVMEAERLDALTPEITDWRAIGTAKRDRQELPTAWAGRGRGLCFQMPDGKWIAPSGRLCDAWKERGRGRACPHFIGPDFANHCRWVNVLCGVDENGVLILDK